MAWGDFFMVPKETFEKRLAICNECDKYDKEKKKCNECGCFMEYKATLRTVSCPLRKWVKEEYKHVTD